LTIDGKPLSSARTPIGGLHKTADGHVCIHDGILVHREALKIFLGCSGENDRDKIARAVAQWTIIDFETAATEAGLAVATLRLFEQWDHHPQAQAISDFPITIRKISDSPPSQDTNLKPGSDKCLRGLRVIEMTRVIAGPVAGRTLSAHGANVLWITSPKLEDQPTLDRDFARGKRTVRLDIDVPEGRARVDSLLENADVFLQSYRPGSLASKGLSPEDLAARSKNGIICANLSAYGPTGPWSTRCGFGSRVQMCPVGC
jgi:crotonobetainyl-CoA:carnitine CoA-transferase CaiB-like acyl-CoA transferase